MTRRLPLLFCVLVATCAISQQQPPAPNRAPNSYVQRDNAIQCWRKLQYIQSNGSAQQPDPNPTTLKEDEVNAYIAAGKVQLPKGVQSVRFVGAPNVITTYARVDFDQITAGSHSMNPLLALFTGVHDIVAVADANGAGGTGVIHVQSVSLDGTNIPRAALQFFVDHYLKPKYPEVGLDTRFKMPYRIDSAEVGEHTLVLKQK